MITGSDALPLRYRGLVVAYAIKLGSRGKRPAYNSFSNSMLADN